MSVMPPPVRVDEAARRAWQGDRELKLPPMQFDLLCMLSRHPGQIVTKQQIVDALWRGYIGNSKAMDVHIQGLRQALGDPAASPRYIITLRGVGYRWDGPAGTDPLAAARAAIERVRELHVADRSNPHGPWCEACLTAWPCRTIRALNGEEVSR